MGYQSLDKELKRLLTMKLLSNWSFYPYAVGSIAVRAVSLQEIALAFPFLEEGYKFYIIVDRTNWY